VLRKGVRRKLSRRTPHLPAFSPLKENSSSETSRWSGNGSQAQYGLNPNLSIGPKVLGNCARCGGVGEPQRLAATAQRAAPSRAVWSLVMTLTGIDSIKCRIRPLSTKAFMNKRPVNLGSSLGAMPPPR